MAQAQPPVGEPPRLREVSVSATRTERDADDVPATVTTIKAEDIERGLVRDIRDLIRYEPGVSAPNDPDRCGATVFRTGIGPNTTAPANAPFGSIDRYTSPGRNAAISLKIWF